MRGSFPSLNFSLWAVCAAGLLACAHAVAAPAAPPTPAPANAVTVQEVLGSLREFEREQIRETRETLRLQAEANERALANLVDQRVNEALKKLEPHVDKLREHEAMLTGYLTFAEIILAGFGISLLTMLFGLRRYVRNETAKTLQKVIADEGEYLRNQVTALSIEAKLLEESQLLAIGATAQEADLLAGWLRAIGFRRVNATTEALAPGQATLTLFHGGLGAERISAQVRASSDEGFVVYTEDQLRFEPDVRCRLNLANSPLTLYPNVINTLKYRERVSGNRPARSPVPPPPAPAPASDLPPAPVAGEQNAAPARESA